MKENAKELATKTATGDFIPKKHKRRSDAGVKMTKTKKKRVGVKTQMPPLNQSHIEGDEDQGDGIQDMGASCSTELRVPHIC